MSKRLAVLAASMARPRCGSSREVSYVCHQIEAAAVPATVDDDRRAGPPDLEKITSTWSQSGTQLTRELMKIAASADVDVDVADEVTQLCARYDALYEVRNDLIHSFRPGRGTERLDVVRAIRIKKGTPLTDLKDLSQRRHLGLGELVDLYYEIDDLTHDVRTFQFRVIGDIK